MPPFVEEVLSKYPFAEIFLVLVGASLLLTAFSALFLRGSAGAGDRYNLFARLFLVALRLAMGWHLFFEGMEKLNTPNWSGEPYLREAMGPLATPFRKVAGDRLVERLAVEDGNLSPRLQSEWANYLDKFTDHYELTHEQIAKAAGVFAQAQSKAVTWFTSNVEDVAKPSAYPPELKVSMTVPERLKENDKYEARVLEVESLLPTSKADVLARYKSAKADWGKWRASLKATLESQTTQFKKDLQSLLTSEQKDRRPLREPTPLPVREWELLEWSDAMVKFGLLALGGCLLVGFFTQLSCFLSGLLVLSFYLAMPPLPGYPEVPRSEGTYLIINKTLIEALALMGLAFIPTGKWAGLDSLLWFFCPWNWRSPTPVLPKKK